MKSSAIRISNLDYLRGLSALGIMLYHYLGWSYGKFQSDSFFGIIGIYGVAIFYILSGITLFHVYEKSLKLKSEDLKKFFKKRVFRIFPLLWLTIIGTIILSFRIPDLEELLLNITGLFGFFQWDNYIATGSWSIGNELVFYFFFPIFLYTYNYSKLGFALLTLFLFFIYLYFAFVVLSPTMSLSSQWDEYINPLNQIFLFLAGFILGTFINKIKVNNYIGWIIFLLGLSFMIFYPVAGNQINIVTGLNRIAFTAACLLVCFGFYKIKFQLNEYLHKGLMLLGELSYSIYLLHPLVESFRGKLMGTFGLELEKSVEIFISISITIFASYVVFTYFEKYFIKLGKSLG